MGKYRYRVTLDCDCGATESFIEEKDAAAEGMVDVGRWTFQPTPTCPQCTNALRLTEVLVGSDITREQALQAVKIAFDRFDQHPDMARF